MKPALLLLENPTATDPSDRLCECDTDIGLWFRNDPEKVIAARAQATGQSYEAMERAYIEKISLRRMVTADDVANQALFLCSELGRNISGQAISICGNVEYL